MRGLRWCSAVVSGGGRASITTAAALRGSQTIHNFGRRFCRCSTGSTSSSVLVELEYADLNLRDNYGVSQLGHVRIRQHVNPLTASFTEPVAVPDWKAVFRDPMLPLMVDIGSGSGRFLIWLAKHLPESRNYLGLEIRQKLVDRSKFWVKDLELQNIYFMYANATVSFNQLVSTYPGPLTLVSILCPDPHFKKRHKKRRVVQNPLVDSISENLSAGGQIFIQSDVLEVAHDMRNQFDSRPDVFEHVDGFNPNYVCDSDGWLLHNPMGIRTDREIHAELEGAKIYRRIYQKCTRRRMIPSRRRITEKRCPNWTRPKNMPSCRRTCIRT